jgi:hypothetical protein
MKSGDAFDDRLSEHRAAMTRKDGQRPVAWEALLTIG